METQIAILYEVVLPDTNEREYTYSREMALECYYDEYMVFEKHITKYKPSIFTDTQTIVSMRWDNNPEFDPNLWEE